MALHMLLFFVTSLCFRLSFRLTNALYVVFLPPFNILSSLLVTFRVRIKVLFLPLPRAFTSAFLAAKALKRFWNKDFFTGKALTVLVHLIRISALLFGLMLLVARLAQGNQIVHAIIAADTNGDDVMDIKGTLILFRCFSAFPTHFIAVTNRLCSRFPFAAIVDIPTAIIPVVFASQPFMQMGRIDEKQSCLVHPYAKCRKLQRFTTPACTDNSGIFPLLCLTYLCLRGVGMLATIERIMLAKFDGFFALIRKTCYLPVSFIRRTCKRLITDNTCFVDSWGSVFIPTGKRTKLSWNLAGDGFIAIEAGRGIRHGLNSLNLRYRIVPHLGVVCKELGYRQLGYSPDEEAAKVQTEAQATVTNYSRGQGLPSAKVVESMPQQDTAQQNAAGMGQE